MAGEPVNPNSPKQLGHILFEVLELPVVKKTKTGYSTSAEVLEALRDSHPIVGRVLDYRQLAKLKSTYVDGLLKLVDAHDRVHTSFNQTVTATGRLSSTAPNLQNIPVRTEEGKRIRRAFIPIEKKNLLISADYSQIELRVLAHLSGDDMLMQSFAKGEDIHRRTASEVFHVPMEEVTAERAAPPRPSISASSTARRTTACRGDLASAAAKRRPTSISISRAYRWCRPSSTTPSSRRAPRAM